MEIIVLKFGGSSVANNKNLEIVANKIIEFKKEYKNVVVVVSAQGKTTDKLIKEAKELSNSPSARELDALTSTGEQISSSKLAILLNSKKYEAISLNAWQAGIMSDGNFQNAKIIGIDTDLIIKKLKENKIVVVTGFQGIDNDYNINTLGRGGSDTTCIALASALNAKKCYIFSDVDGIYTSDPNEIKSAKKLKNISYIEMENASFEGAKVLHDRSVELAKKYNLPIVAASTFNDNKGTNIVSDIEKPLVKSIIKNDKIIIASVKTKLDKLIKLLEKNKIKYGSMIKRKERIEFSIFKDDKEKLERELKEEKIDALFNNASKISIIGSGISNDFGILEKISKVVLKYKGNIILIDNSAYKISIQFDKVMDTEILQKLHDELIK